MLSIFFVVDKAIKTYVYLQKYRCAIQLIKNLLLIFQIGTYLNIQGDPNQNLLIQMAVTVKIFIFDPMLLMRKCVWEV